MLSCYINYNCGCMPWYDHNALTVLVRCIWTLLISLVKPGFKLLLNVSTIYGVWCGVLVYFYCVYNIAVFIKLTLVILTLLFLYKHLGVKAFVLVGKSI